MRKIYIVIGVSILIVLSIVFSLFNRQPSPVTNVDSTPTSTSQQSTNMGQRGGLTGQFLNYKDVDLASVNGQKVLFFHAPWCPQCRSIENGINAQGVPDGLTIIKVDYDTNQELRRKYGVTLQTTFVKINDNGEFISKYVAYDEPTFESVKRNFLEQ